MISKILFLLVLSTFIEQNIVFPETCFANTISEQKFAVCHQNFSICTSIRDMTSHQFGRYNLTVRPATPISVLDVFCEKSISLYLEWQGDSCRIS